MAKRRQNHNISDSVESTRESHPTPSDTKQEQHRIAASDMTPSGTDRDHELVARQPTPSGTEDATAQVFGEAIHDNEGVFDPVYPPTDRSQPRTSTNIPQDLHNLLAELAEITQFNRADIITNAIEIYASLIVDQDDSGAKYASRTGTLLTYYSNRMKVHPGRLARLGASLFLKLLETRSRSYPHESSIFRAIFAHIKRKNARHASVNDFVVEAIQEKLQRELENEP